MVSVQPITVAQYGIGPIGAEIVKLLLTKSWIKIIAAVDVDPQKIGKDLGEVIGIDHKLGVIVTANLKEKPAVVCHSRRRFPRRRRRRSRSGAERRTADGDGRRSRRLPRAPYLAVEPLSAIRPERTSAAVNTST